MEEEVSSVAEETNPETRKFSLEFEVADYVELERQAGRLAKALEARES